MKFKVGDMVKITNNTGEWTGGEYKNGDILVVKSIFDKGESFHAKRLNGSDVLCYIFNREAELYKEKQMTKGRLQKLLDDGFYIPVELRDGTKTVIRPNGYFLDCDDDDTDFDNLEEDLMWCGDGSASDFDIIKVYEAVKPLYNNPTWVRDDKSEIRKELDELEKRSKEDAKRIAELKEKL